MTWEITTEFSFPLFIIPSIRCIFIFPQHLKHHTQNASVYTGMRRPADGELQIQCQLEKGAFLLSNRCDSEHLEGKWWIWGWYVAAPLSAQILACAGHSRNLRVWNQSPISKIQTLRLIRPLYSQGPSVNWAHKRFCLHESICSIYYLAAQGILPRSIYLCAATVCWLNQYLFLRRH